MAEKTEKVEILNIETKQTEKSLKDLRMELKQLKSQLEEMVIGSDEYKNTLQEITQRQQQLSSVTKSSVSDMEGSYNALSKELSELRKAWKATNDEAERDSLGQQMGEINSKLKELDASVGNFQRNVGNYSSALDGLDDKLKDTGFSFDDAIESSNHWVAKGENIEKTSIAMVASFAMIDQAMSLMGEESEGTRKVLEKLQIVMAMTAGFKQIAEGARGFLQLSKSINISKIALTGFKSAMVATGIGALVVAVGALIVNWDKISAMWNDTSSIDKSTAALKEMEGVLSQIDYETEKAIAVAKARGESDIAILEVRLQKALEAEEKAAEAHRNAVKREEREKQNSFFGNATDETKELVKNTEEVWIERSKVTQEIRDQLSIQKEIQPILDENNKKIEEERKKQEAITKFQEKQNELANKKTNAQNEVNDILKSALKGREQIEDVYQQQTKSLKMSLDENLITREDYDKAILVLTQRREEQIKEIEVQETRTALEELRKEYDDWYKESSSKYRSEMTDASIAGNDSEMYKLTQSFLDSQKNALEELKNKLLEYGDAAKDIVKDIDIEISDIGNEKKTIQKEEQTRQKEEKTGLDEAKLEKVLELGDILIATADEIGSAWSRVFVSINKGIEEVGNSINKGEKGWTKYGKIASAGIGVASSMLGTLADMQDTQTEEGFEKNKKLQIAAATMSMLAGIVNTWQSVMSKENSWMTIWGQVAAGTSISAMMLATGLAQINQIKSTSFEGGGSGAASVSPNVTALSAIQNPVQAVNEIQGASTEGEVKDQRVYVLEYDIASTNKKVNVAQSEATF